MRRDENGSPIHECIPGKRHVFPGFDKLCRCGEQRRDVEGKRNG